MRSNIDLNLLRCFQALLAEQSVSRAARHVGIAQPSMSYALRRLRNIFDDPLFVNANGKMVPTARAKALGGDVHNILVRSELLLASGSRFDPGAADLDLTVMAAEYAEYLLLPPLLARLRAQAPSVRLHFQAASRERAFELMERGEVDFRLAWWTEPAKTLRVKNLFSDSFVGIARHGHPAVRNGQISAAAFLDGEHAVVEPHRSGMAYAALEVAFTRRKRVRRVAVYVQDALSLCNIVRQSDLLAALPQRFAHQLAGIFGLQVMPIPLTVGVARQSLYWHERTHKLPSHRWFRELVGEVATQI